MHYINVAALSAIMSELGSILQMLNTDANNSRESFHLLLWQIVSQAHVLNFSSPLIN
jgi:hypothetical protein